MVAKESEQTLQRDDPAPAFELPATDGKQYSLADLGEYEALLLVFTCNHCPYAQAKFDLLNELAAAYDDVAVVGVNPNDAEQYPDDSFERMTELVRDGTVEYDAYLRDESQETARDYGAVCTPDPFLFRNEGGPDEPRFLLSYHGRLDDAMNPDEEPTEFYVRQAIDSILAGESVNLEFMPSRGCSIKWRED
jgi:peroxiredoxin